MNPLEIVESPEAREHITWLLGQVRAVYPEQYADIFVSETRDAEGRQIINSVWLFFSSIAVEIKSPTLQDSFDAQSFKTLRYVQINKQNFDFDTLVANDSSRVSVMVIFTDEITGQFQASRVNCGHLMRITKQWLMPRVSS